MIPALILTFIGTLLTAGTISGIRALHHRGHNEIEAAKWICLDDERGAA